MLFQAMERLKSTPADNESEHNNSEGQANDSGTAPLSIIISKPGRVLTITMQQAWVSRTGFHILRTGRFVPIPAPSSLRPSSVLHWQQSPLYRTTDFVTVHQEGVSTKNAK